MFVFFDRHWLAVVAGLALFALGLLWWSYYHRGAPGWTRFLCGLLKYLALAALLLFLLEPSATIQRVKPGSNWFAVVVDNSEGMQIRDAETGVPRAQMARDLITGAQQKWLTRLEGEFQVKRYYFDSRLQATEDFGQLDFKGDSTALFSALRDLKERYQSRPLAGIILLSDGNATDAQAGGEIPGLPPVYPVLIGTEKAVRDLAVENVAVTQTGFEDSPVTVQAEVSAAGYQGGQVEAHLLQMVRSTDAAASGTNRSTATVVQRITQKVEREDKKLHFRFQVRPEKSGVAFYQVRVTEPGGARVADAQAPPEATLANNHRLVVVDRSKGPYRVLYVGGRPNWEYKFLNRALAGDDQLKLVGLLRIAKREPKFDFRGRSGETSNPLFRGFDRKSETTERYDKPVLQRLNLEDENELRGGFPVLAEELYAYHAVILDDVEAEFFTHDQMLLLQQYVSERGGGLLMLGGQESFREGGYERTPLAQVLPVYLDALPNATGMVLYQWDLTREGWLQPWLRLRATQGEERERIDAMPPFEVMNRTRNIKPGASVLAQVQASDGQNFPAIVGSRYGHGRSAALLLGDWWRWGFAQEESHLQLTRAWRQMIRWLVSEVPGRIEVEAKPDAHDPGRSVRVHVRARDKLFRPLDNATVKVTVRRAVGDPTDAAQKTKPGEARDDQTGMEVTAEPVATERGAYEATVTSRANGGYIARIEVADPDGGPVGRAETAWPIDPVGEEFRSLRPNRALLGSIAQKTGGELVKDLDRLVAQLPNRKAPIMEQKTRPLWHTPALFVFVAGCLAAEWGLRRARGMP